MPDLIPEEDTVLHGISLDETDFRKDGSFVTAVPISLNKLLGIRYTYRVLRL